MGDVEWDEIDAALAVTAESLDELGFAADGPAARGAGRAAYATLAGVPAQV
jgi:hypothetical protein